MDAVNNVDAINNVTISKEPIMHMVWRKIGLLQSFINSAIKGDKSFEIWRVLGLEMESEGDHFASPFNNDPDNIKWDWDLHFSIRMNSELLTAFNISQIINRNALHRHLPGMIADIESDKSILWHYDSWLIFEELLKRGVQWDFMSLKEWKKNKTISERKKYGSEEWDSADEAALADETINAIDNINYDYVTHELPGSDGTVSIGTEKREYTINRNSFLVRVPEDILLWTLGDRVNNDINHTVRESLWGVQLISVVYSHLLWVYDNGNMDFLNKLWLTFHENIRIWDEDKYNRIKDLFQIA